MTSQIRRQLLATLIGLVVSAGVSANAYAALRQVDAESSILKVVLKDSDGAIVGNGVVRTESVGQGTTKEANANQQGIYEFLFLRPGVYRISASAPGFRPRVIEDTSLELGQIYSITLDLSLETVATDITVTSEAAVLSVERSHQGNVISNLQISSLPNLSRDFSTLVLTSPGVSNSNAPRAQFVGFDAAFITTGYSIAGSNGRSNLFTIDGGENELGSGQLRIRNISPEAVQEFQINRNAYTAEFGFTSGSVINVVTKSGTNELRGSVYGFYRSNRTSARNYFNPSSRKPFDQRISPGLTFGGPLVTNRVFVFTSYEGLTARTARFRSYTASPQLSGPTAGQNAYIAALLSDPDPAAQRLASQLRQALTPANYPETMKLLRENEGTFRIPTSSNTLITRVDFQTRKHSVNARVSLATNNEDQLGPSNEQAPGAGTVLSVRDWTSLLTWTMALSSSTISQTRVQIVPAFSGKNLPRSPTSTGINLLGFAIFGHNTVTPLQIRSNRFQLEQAFAFSREGHRIKFGVSIRPVKYDMYNEIFFNGLFSFPSGSIAVAQALSPADRDVLSSFNLRNGFPPGGSTSANLTSLQAFGFGLPSQWQQGFNDASLKITTLLLGSYVQDSWQVRPGVVIDAGVRLDTDTQPEPIGTHSYLSPRLGFAWNVSQSHKTVIRGGSGMFVAPIYIMVPLRGLLQLDNGRHINQVITTSNDGSRSPAALWAYGRKLGVLPNTALTEAQVQEFGISTAPHSPNRRINEIDPDYRNAYSVHASFGIETELLPNLNVELAWSMQRSVHLPVSHNANYRESGIVDPIWGPRLVRIVPDIAVNNVFKSIGNGTYHGMTMSATKQFRNFLRVQTNYTWSKAIDDVTDFNGQFFAFLPTRLYLDRAVSTFDIPHNFVGTFVYKPVTSSRTHWLHRGVTFSGILSWRSGIPFTARAGVDVNGDASVNYDRPFFAGRNTGRGARYFGLDMRLEKSLFERENQSLSFLIEASNALNHTNFLSVNDVIGANADLLRGPFNFRGRKDLPPTSPLGFTSAAEPRQIQFGIRLRV